MVGSPGEGQPPAARPRHAPVAGALARSEPAHEPVRETVDFGRSPHPVTPTSAPPVPAAMPRSAGAIVATVALLVAGIAAVVLDVVAPGAGPLVQPVSSFAHTTYAWLWRLEVGTAAVALVLLAVAVRRRAATATFTGALYAAGVGLGAAGGCATDLWFPWERPPTFSGAVHLAAVVLVLVAFAVAMALRARSLPRAAAAGWSRACELAYFGCLAGAVVYVGASATAGRAPHLFGLWERLVLASALAWSGVLAAGVLRPRGWRPTTASTPAR